MARDTRPRKEGPCDDLVAGPLGRARDRLRKLLPPEAETLVTVIAWIEVAMESSVDPFHRKDIQKQCREALRFIERIERRHPGGELPEDLAEGVSDARKDVERALQRLGDDND